MNFKIIQEFEVPPDDDTGAEDVIYDEDVAGAPDEIRKTPGREDLVIAKRWVVVVKDLPSLLKEIYVRRNIPWYQQMAMKIGVCTVCTSNLYRNL